MGKSSAPAPATTSEETVIRHDIDIEEHAIDDTIKLKVIVVGAGITGITAAVLLPEKVPGIDLVVYERDSDISTFAPALGWSEHYAQGAEIKKYWTNIAVKYRADRVIKCNHVIKSAEWNEERAKWVITVESPQGTFVDQADFLITATGVFSQPKLPSYPGISEFTGHIIHSSRWDHSFDATGKSIAIIGNGASGMQVLPQLHKIASRIDHYARSPTWVAPSFGDDPADRLNDDIRATFTDPDAYLQYRKRMENRSFTGFGNSVKGGHSSTQLRERATDLMKERLGDRTDLLQAIIPEFSPSCRRLTPGPGYLEAITQPNVEYITTEIEAFTKSGIRTIDGKERIVDAIVCSTGADTSFAPPFRLQKENIDLATAWKPDGSVGYPRTYLGIATPGFPNLLFINGPQAAAVTGTSTFSIENQITLAARVLRKVQSQGIRTISPTEQATEDFQAYCDAYFPRTVLKDNCRSWFNNGVAGGKILANWPGSGLHANLVRREPRWEDWQYTYWTSSGNRFAYLGNGWTRKDQLVNQGSSKIAAEVDLTPYLNVASVTGGLDLRGYHENWYDI
ncbi:hypothetical protein N0V90_005657 [Kalmusia sp. IMI 367209]|nr:hypothetical protein N0V90_005657 [Kalmusia sp. IMI 367209]